MRASAMPALQCVRKFKGSTACCPRCPRRTLAGLVFDLHDAEGAHERRLSDFEVRVELAMACLGHLAHDADMSSSPQLVSLMNLRPTTVDMTRAVLPSLNDLNDDDIAGILGTLASTASSLMA